ncbi:MAG: TonB-dependent receptor plug domain-containing protein [Bacteroidales bacterium]
MSIPLRNSFRLIFPLLLLLVFSFVLKEDEDPRLRIIVEQFNSYMAKNLQQKVYLHTDREVYEAPGDIWFKAYLVSGTAQRPDSLSTSLIVELINPRNVVVQTRQLRMSAGTGKGDFVLTDTIPEGTYIIRAYTNWMNHYRDFVYSRSFYIRNPSNANFISAEDLRYNKRVNRKIEKGENRFAIQFLPESGILTPGIQSRVAFRTENELGKGVPASGIILNSKKQEVLRFSTLAHGLGSFLFTPEKGEKYRAMVSFNGKKEVEAGFPELIRQAYVMRFEREAGGMILIHAASSFPLTEDPQANDIILVGQTRGKIYYAKLIDMPRGSIDLRIPEALFPTGITQFTLFNGRGIPMAERLVFIHHADQLSIGSSGMQESYGRRKEGVIDFQVKDHQGVPVTGSFSVSVVKADSTGQSNSEPSITSCFLLTSDLGGAVENADFLLENTTESAREELDLVMLTHGWRRFSWPVILSGKYPDYGSPADNAISVSGRITRELFGVPVPRANVYLSVLNTYNDYFKMVADENGRFRFDGLDYADTINVVMEANRPNGRKNVLILLDENELSQEKTARIEELRQEMLSRGTSWKYANVRRPDYSYQDRKNKEKLENTKPYKIHSEADNVIYMSDVPEGYSDLFQVLQGRVPGVSVTGDDIIIRGVNSFIMGSEPLFLIDGVMVDKGTFKALNPRDVELIEVLKGPGTAVYGSRGGNGVIAAYTKRGEFGKKGYIEFSMLGYTTPRIFYSPVYDPGKPLNPATDNRDVLLWAPELIPDQNGIVRVRFFTSDQPGEYILKLEGMDRNGKTGVLKSRFSVESEK